MTQEELCHSTYHYVFPAEAGIQEVTGFGF